MSAVFSLDLGVDGADELLKVAIHVCEMLEALLGVHGLVLGLLVDLSDARVERCLTLSDPVNVLLAFIDASLFVLLASASHLGEVGLAGDLVLRAAHGRLDAADDGLGGGVFTSKASLFDFVLDLLAGQKTALLHDFFALLSQLLAERAQLLASGVGVGVLLVVGEHVVLHPVDVKRAGLLTIDR